MKTKIPDKFLLYALIFSVFVSFRILNLLNQSPFVDEAYYVHLATSIRGNLSINNLFFPLDQGLSPVFMYLTAISMIFLKNPLFAGRFTSFLIFLASIFVFARYLKKIKAKNFVLPLIFFSFNPFLFLYSQMALLETSMIFFAVFFMLLTEITISSKKIFVFSLLLVMNLYLVIFSKATGTFIMFYTLVRFLQEKKYKTLMTFIVFSFANGIIFFPILKLLFATVKMHGHSRALSFPDFMKNARLIHIWIIDY